MSEPTDISVPHGLQQNIKMELLGLIHSGENPFHIICRLAEYLEDNKQFKGQIVTGRELGGDPQPKQDGVEKAFYEKNPELKK